MILVFNVPLTANVNNGYHTSCMFPLHLHVYQFKSNIGASLVAQWLRIHLPMQGTQVRALVREDPTCRGATKPVRHNH